MWHGNKAAYTYRFPLPKKWFWCRTSTSAAGGDSDLRTVSPGNFCLFSETLPTTYGKVTELGKFYLKWTVRFKKLVPCEYQPYQEWFSSDVAHTASQQIIYDFPDAKKIAPSSEQMVHNSGAGATVDVGPGKLIMNAGYGVNCALAFNLQGTITQTADTSGLRITTWNGDQAFADSTSVLAPNTNGVQIDYLITDATTHITAFSALIVTPANSSAGQFSLQLGWTSFTGTTNAIVDIWVQPTQVFTGDLTAPGPSRAFRVAKMMPRWLTKSNPKGQHPWERKGQPREWYLPLGERVARANRKESWVGLSEDEEEKKIDSPVPSRPAVAVAKAAASLSASKQK
jgi:hypothetical protein